MIMKVWACADAKTLLDGFGTAGWPEMIRACRFDGFLVLTYDVSRDIDIADVAKVKHILDEEGYGMIGCGVAAGHPVGLDTPCYTYHEGWHIRKDINGEPVRWCSAITPRFIGDAVAHMRELKDVGVLTMFWDDDLRQGNYEGDVQGCFCDECLNEFIEKNRPELSADTGCEKLREMLRPVIKRDPAGLSPDMLALRELWIRFNCERVTRFMSETNIDGMRNGIMVMHNGDRRHGIDIPGIRKAVPDCLFRVGELMFDDASFERPGNRRALVEGVLRHMALMGDVSRVYSESTVYPHGALSPENLRRKIVLERRCGIENINLMGIERMNSEEYYHMLRDNHDYFESVEKDLTPDNIDAVS